MKKPIIFSVLFFIITAISSFGQVSTARFDRTIDEIYDQLDKIERDKEDRSEVDKVYLRVATLEGKVNATRSGFSDDIRELNQKIANLNSTQQIETDIVNLRNDHLGVKSQSDANRVKIEEIEKLVKPTQEPDSSATFNIVYQNIDDISDQVTMVLEVPSNIIDETPNLNIVRVEGSSLSVTRGDVTENFNDVTIMFNSNNVSLDLTKELVGQAGLSGRDVDNIVGDFNLGTRTFFSGDWSASDEFLIRYLDGSRYKLTSLKCDYEPPVTIQSNKSEIDTIKNEMETMKAQLQTLVASVAEKDAQIAEKDAKIAELEQGGGGQSIEEVLEQVRDARAGSVVLTVDPEGDNITLGLTIEQSDNLIEWTKLDGEMTRTIPIPDGKKFYRFALDN